MSMTNEPAIWLHAEAVPDAPAMAAGLLRHGALRAVTQGAWLAAVTGL